MLVTASALSDTVAMPASASCVGSNIGVGSGSVAAILESIECRGGSIADDVSFSAVVQRIFTKTLSNST